jgi:RNA polymerase-binding protein DksA
MQDEATVFADPNDRASQESDMSLELRNRDRERKLIKNIDKMLGRIEAGDYGYCDKCGVEIGLSRLGSTSHRHVVYRLQDARRNKRAPSRKITLAACNKQKSLLMQGFLFVYSKKCLEARPRVELG